jgi:peptidoglycan/xylan/chitin deacetylase (PgdA/CDA1 family)
VARGVPLLNAEGIAMWLGRVKRAIRVGVAGGLYYTGALTLWQRIVLRRRAVVLMYHRVLRPEERALTGSHPGIVVTRDTFARHMAILKRRFRVLSPEEFAHHLRHRLPFPDSSCLITFDDGWHDNLVNGLPILREHGLPALIFLPVDFIGGRRLFWREALTHLLVCVSRASTPGSERRERFVALLRSQRLQAVVDVEGADAHVRISEIVAAQPGLTEAATASLVKALCTELHIGVEELDTPDRFIGWDEAQLMARQGVIFGGHGASHRLLAGLPHHEMVGEIARARSVMDEKFPGMLASFSYPNGSWNDAVAASVSEAGYALAFTTVPGVVECQDDPMALRRRNVHEHTTDTAPTFIAAVLGLF